MTFLRPVFLAAACAVVAALTGCASAPFAQSSSDQAEVQQLIHEGQELFGNNRLRATIQGLKSPVPSTMGDLVPEWVPVAPKGWSLGVQGFERSLAGNPRGAALCAAINRNAQQEQAGNEQYVPIYECVADERGPRMVFRYDVTPG